MTTIFFFKGGSELPVIERVAFRLLSYLSLRVLHSKLLSYMSLRVLHSDESVAFRLLR